MECKYDKKKSKPKSRSRGGEDVAADGKSQKAKNKKRKMGI